MASTTERTIEWECPCCNKSDRIISDDFGGYLCKRCYTFSDSIEPPAPPTPDTALVLSWLDSTAKDFPWNGKAAILIRELLRQTGG
jgi:hypothetical protein